MAILPSCPDVEVNICIDGEPVKEYDTENEPSIGLDAAANAHQLNCTVTKYIESFTGKEFTIQTSTGKGFKFTSSGIQYRIHVDGQKISGVLVSKKRFDKATTTLKKICKGQIIRENGQPMENTFKFASIKTTSEAFERAKVDEQKSNMACVGEIRISIGRVSNLRESRNPGRVIKELGKTGLTSNVHEKALLGDPKSHRLEFGAKRPVSSSVWNYKTLGDIKYPIAVYKFKYRSRESLQTLLVIPRPLPPSPILVASPKAEYAENPSSKFDPKIKPEIKAEVEVATEPAPFPAAAGAAAVPIPAINLNNLTLEQNSQTLLLLIQGLLGNGLQGTAPAASTAATVPDPQAPTIKRERLADEDNSRTRKKNKKYKEKTIIDLTDDGDENAIVLD